jgi:hypothetical protein
LVVPRASPRRCSTHDLWYHGIGTNNNDGIIHPFNSSTDGVYRSSCIGFQITSGHSNVECRIEQHNHVGGTEFGDVNVGSQEPSASGHHESSQTGMAHHHHSNN